MTDEIWEPAVGDEVILLGGTYREEARTARVERLTKTQIVVTGPGPRFRREVHTSNGEPYYRGIGGDRYVSAPDLYHPSSYRARRVLAETEERRARIDMRHSAELLEKDPRRDGGVFQLRQAIERLERAVTALDTIYAENPAARPYYTR